MGGGGGSFQMAESEAKSRTGLRGTQYQGNAEKQANNQGMLMSDLNEQLFSSPQATMNLGKQMYDGGKYGLGNVADSGVEALGRYQFGQASGEAATRGQLNPDNFSAVVGSSIQNMLPFLIPQMQQTQQSQFMAPQSLMQGAKTSADYWNRALGSESDASSSSFGISANAFASDITMKEAIERIGTHILGIGIYVFRYVSALHAQYGSGLYLGVMAQDVLQVCPEAVSRHADGYLMVDYSKL